MLRLGLSPLVPVGLYSSLATTLHATLDLMYIAAEHVVYMCHQVGQAHQHASNLQSGHQINTSCINASHRPVPHSIPVPPTSLVQVSGALQVSPFWQGILQTAVSVHMQGVEVVQI